MNTSGDLPDIPLPAGIRSRFVDGINGLRMHVLEAGFEIGVVCSTGPASANQDPLLLDRLNAWSPSPASFALALARATISGS